MHVHTTKSLTNLNALKEVKAESIYLHEYVHFMQDVSTFHGLCNVGIVADYMRFANRHIVDNKLTRFKVPLHPIPLAPDNVDLNNRIQGHYNGYGDEGEALLVDHRIVEHTVEGHGGERTLECVEVDYTDSAGVTKTFEFGATSVAEGMAYIIQKMCYPSSHDSPDIPYSSAEKLAELVHPDFAKDRLNVLALCDASHLQPHPGLVFYETLLRIRNQGIQVNRPEDIYDLYHGAGEEAQRLNSIAAYAIDQMRGYFNDVHFDPVKDWFTSMINRAVKYRLSNISFPVDIARGGPFGKNAALLKFMTEVGTPLVTNDDSEATLHDPRDPNGTGMQPHYDLIWALNQIHLIFWGEQRNCEMVSYCRSGKVPTDARCASAPWTRSTDDQSCAFGRIWHHWGMDGHAPVYR
jgi:hypothetical protein